MNNRKTPVSEGRKVLENFSMVLARSSNKVIAYQGSMPWKCPEDMAYFKNLTSGNICISGYNTYITLNANGLSNRKLYVLTSKNLENKPAVFFIKTLDEFLNLNIRKKVFCIGGLKTYTAFLPYTSKIYLTELKLKCKGDTFFPDTLLEGFSCKSLRETECCEYLLYERIK